MLDKDKVLPLVHFGQCMDTVHRLRCHEDQQDADWERVKPLVEALHLHQIASNDAHFHVHYGGTASDCQHKLCINARQATKKALAQLEEKP